jgi:hypothetical protein
VNGISFLAESVGPPWLPASVADARRFAYWGQLICFVFFLVLLFMGILSVVFNAYAYGAYMVVSGIVNLIIVFLLKTTVFDAIDQGRFNEASDRLLIWAILGLIFSIIPGILLLIAFLRIQSVFQPQYQPYPPQQYQQPPQQYQQQPPQQYQQPPQQYQTPSQPSPRPQPEPSQPSSKPKPEMVKCKKCGVQYPAFMRTCPNCGEPR